ncbi:glyoxylate/hydroxypyruvate reductase A [mine drainage metagenome]|uniref:Glyoxylate/hydroxypyruvate reductase A n=1 Tax=mine drainage metagenome TaxID=410659 RepID=A0A1J5QWS3_9ZZZZ
MTVVPLPRVLTVPDAAIGAALALPEQVRLLEWPMTEELPAEVAAEVDAVVVPHYVSGEMLARLRPLTRLSLVQLPSAGYEHAVRHLPPGVTLCNGRGVHDDETAELAIGLLLASLRELAEYVRLQDAGIWSPHRSTSLADRRVMVVGAGSIGHAIAARLRPFAVDVVRVARSGRDDVDGHVHGVDELAVLLPTVDVVVLITPLTAETTHLVDAAFLARMRDGSLLVNVSRGKVVDTDALMAELRSGRLRAALDVVEPEPLPPDHPLWTSPGVILTPHVGGNTTATHVRFVALVQRQLERLAAGEPLLNVVVPG